MTIRYLLLTLLVLAGIYGFNTFQAARERAWRMTGKSKLKQIAAPSPPINTTYP